MTSVFSKMRTLGPSVPPLIMAAGTATFYQADIPAEVRAGGVCLTAIALIVLDLQNGKKLGYTDGIVKALRKVPGMEKASEGEVLGALVLATSAFLGIPETVRMVQDGVLDAGVINNLGAGLDKVFSLPLFESGKLLFG